MRHDEDKPVKPETHISWRLLTTHLFLDPAQVNPCDHISDDLQVKMSNCLRKKKKGLRLAEK